MWLISSLQYVYSEKLYLSQSMESLCSIVFFSAESISSSINWSFLFIALPLSLTLGEMRSFWVRLYSGFLTETQVSASGNLSNRCWKHLYMLRFRKCGLVEVHSLNSRMRKFSETAELLLTATFALSVNSTNKQKQSNKFHQQIKGTVGCYDTFGYVRFRKKKNFLIGNPVGMWMFNSGKR